MAQNYSNIVEPDSDGCYKKLYEVYRDKYREAAKSGGGIPKDYPLAEKSLYNNTISVEAGQQIIPLDIDNDDFEDWTVTINGENVPLGVFEGGFPAYYINTGSSIYGVIDGTSVGEGVIFISLSDSSTDFEVSIVQKCVDENFVQGVKSSIDELDYPYEYKTEIKYDITVTIPEGGDTAQTDIPGSEDLSQCSIYVNDVKLIFNENYWSGKLNDSTHVEFYSDSGFEPYELYTADVESEQGVPGDYTIRVESADVNLNDRFHDGVDSVLTEYDLATPRAVKYDGPVTIADEFGTPIPFAPGTDISDYQQWKVYVDNKELLLTGQQFEYTDPDTQVEYYILNRNSMWGLSTYDPNVGEPVLGTYNVNISIPGHSNISSDILVVRISGDENTGYTASMTYSEITGALDNGKTVVAYIESLKRVVPLRGSRLTEGK